MPPSPTKCFAVARTWLFCASWLPSRLALQAGDHGLHRLRPAPGPRRRPRRPGPSGRRGPRTGTARSPTGCRSRGPRSRSPHRPLGQRRDRGWRRCRCCAARSSRRPRCCGRARRRRRRSAGSAAGSPARRSWKPSIMSAQAGRRVRRRHRAAAGQQRAERVRRRCRCGTGSALRSAWVIWPTFSASVIRASRSSTRFFTGSLRVEVRQAVRVDRRPAGSRGSLRAGDGELERDRLGGLGGAVLAGGDRRRSATVPDAVPAGKVNVPETGV